MSAGVSVTRATGFGVTTTVQLSLALPPAAVSVARPGARAVTRPMGVTSTTPGRLDFQVTRS